MSNKNLDDWFLSQEVRRLTFDNITNLAHSCHDVDDDIPDTRGRSPYLVAGEEADPDSLRPFEAICFKNEEYEIILTAIALMLEQDIEIDGELYSSAEADAILAEGELAGMNLPLHRMELDSQGEVHQEKDDFDFGPTTISGRKLVVLKQGHLREKDTQMYQRLSQAKTSGLKQDHRRKVVDLPMLASQIEF